MAILYVFSVNDPNNVGPFPPSVVASTWYQTMQEYAAANTPGDVDLFSVVVTPVTQEYGAFFFKDETDFYAFMATNTLTDASLLADIDAWKTAHSVTHHHKIYSISDTNASTPKFI